MSSVANQRQRVLGGLLLVAAFITIVALIDVLATVFFAVTVAYILAPLRRWVRRRGVGATAATILVTVSASIAVLLLLAPIVVVLFYRIDEAFALLAELPEQLELEVAGQSIVFVLADLLEMTRQWLRTAAINASTALPVLLVKFALFVFVVFGLLHNERDLTVSAFTVIPPNYRDIAENVHRRARDTLFAIYILQGLTAFATVLLALPVFYFFGYESWIALATLAGILQFVPVVGPSALIIVLVVAEALTGSLASAALLLVVGGVLIAAFPDVVIRPRLAEMTTELSSVLYFVGFIGGLISLGAIGVIVGPLLIAVLLEIAHMVAEGFAEETTPRDQASRRPDPLSPDEIG